MHFAENPIRITIEDSTTGKAISLDVKGGDTVQGIVDLIVEHTNMPISDRITRMLVYNGRGFKGATTVQQLTEQFGLIHGDKLALWTKVQEASTISNGNCDCEIYWNSKLRIFDDFNK